MIRRALIPLMMMLAAGCASEPAATVAPPPPRDDVSIAVEDATLGNVIARLSSRPGQNVLVAPDVADEHVTLTLGRTRWRDAVDLLARLTKCDVRALPGGTLVLERRPRVTIQCDANSRVLLELIAAYSSRPIVIAGDVRGDVMPDLMDVEVNRAFEAIARVNSFAIGERGDVVVASRRPIARLRPLDGNGALIADARLDAIASSRAIDLDLDQAPLARAASELARLAGIELRVAEKIAKTPVSLHARGAPWKDIVLFIARTAPARISVRGDAISLEPNDAGLLSITCSRAKAEHVFPLLARYCFSRGACDVDPELGMVEGMTARDVTPEVAIELLAEMNGLTVDGVFGLPLAIHAYPKARARVLADRARPAPAAASIAPIATAIRAKAEAAIDRLARAPTDEKAVEWISDLHAALVDGGDDAIDAAERRLAAQRALEKQPKLRDAIRLEIDTTRGNRLLERMGRAFQRDEFDDILATFGDLSERALAMKQGHPDDEFARNAESLLDRGRWFAQEARKLRPIAGLGLEVEATVTSSSPTIKDAAVISGRVYAPGDAIVGRDGKPVSGLFVQNVQDGMVRLQLDGASFFRWIRFD